ncbi:MAG: GTPase SAR1 family protein, partial [Granulosicoccus sp.]
MKKQMTLSTNPELELAFQFVQYTNKNIFLTGKAGTGKTTFLHRVKKECIKRAVVVAPTGVAAINAKGMTIHSFFQLPFGPYLPSNKNDPRQQRRFSKDKRNLIKSLDLLIIDEISMVRADLLDGIDDVLRRYKNPTEPFGGVQLLMIGDLHQLPPVVKNEEWHLLKDHYSTAYFFGSQALQKTYPITIQLQKIYRQSDSIFIDLLNKVRDNQMDQDVLQQLNSRFIDNFKPADDEGYITLTSHNNTANTINKEKLNSLSEKPFHFKAKITGDFPPHTFPTEEKLEFKVGAQVLFIKNDASPDKLYYNGKIGQVTRISKDEIYVKCPTDLEEIKVSSVEWDNVKYSLNDGTKEVDEDVVGTFSQFPLKLAWAITIHKSQGLTFERVIIDAQSAFAHGQVYVALSRCTSFEGIVLRSQIAYSSVKTDAVVKNHSKDAEENAPDEAHLLQSKKAFQQKLIVELFSFKYIQKVASRVLRNFIENENSLTIAATEKIQKWINNAHEKVFSVAPKFEKQLEYLIYHTEIPEENEELLERIQKASIYFSEQIENELESQ